MSTFSSPATSTLFIAEPSGPGVDDEALDHALDDPLVRRGIRAQADVEAAEEGQELADDGVDEGLILVGEHGASPGIHDQVPRSRRKLGGYAGAYHDAAGADALAAKLVQHVELIGPGERICGKERHDERVAVDGGHGAVAQAP